MILRLVVVGICLSCGAVWLWTSHAAITAALTAVRAAASLAAMPTRALILAFTSAIAASIAGPCALSASNVALVCSTLSTPATNATCSGDTVSFSTSDGVRGNSRRQRGSLASLQLPGRLLSLPLLADCCLLIAGPNLSGRSTKGAGNGKQQTATANSHSKQPQQAANSKQRQQTAAATLPRQLRQSPRHCPDLVKTVLDRRHAGRAVAQGPTGQFRATSI